VVCLSSLLPAEAGEDAEPDLRRNCARTLEVWQGIWLSPAGMAQYNCARTVVLRQNIGAVESRSPSPPRRNVVNYGGKGLKK